MRTVARTFVIVALVAMGSASVLESGALKEADLYRAATIVAEVKVASYQDCDVSRMEFYTVQVEQVLKGEMKSRTELVRVPKKASSKARVAGGGKINVGDRATLYVKIEQGLNGPSQYVLGLMPIHGGGHGRN